MNKQLIILMVAVLLICVGLSGCNEKGNTHTDENSNVQYDEKSKFIGEWEYLGETAWTFKSDNSVINPFGTGTYEIDKQHLIVTTGGFVYTYEYTFLNDDTLLRLDRSEKAFTLERK